MSEKILENLFLHEKPAKIIIGLKTGKDTVYATLLAKEANCTYSHTINILNIFRKLGIVDFEKKGRINKVTLTENGWDIAHHLESLTKKFLKLEEPKKKKKK